MHVGSQRARRGRRQRQLWWSPAGQRVPFASEPRRAPCCSDPRRVGVALRSPRERVAQESRSGSRAGPLPWPRACLSDASTSEKGPGGEGRFWAARQGDSGHEGAFSLTKSSANGPPAYDPVEEGVQTRRGRHSRPADYRARGGVGPMADLGPQVSAWEPGVVCSFDSAPAVKSAAFSEDEDRCRSLLWPGENLSFGYSLQTFGPDSSRAQSPAHRLPPRCPRQCSQCPAEHPPARLTLHRSDAWSPPARGLLPGTQGCGTLGGGG